MSYSLIGASEDYDYESVSVARQSKRNLPDGSDVSGEELRQRQQALKAAMYTRNPERRP